MSPVVIGNATLYLGDCLEILPTLPKVDAVITDPPYGIGFEGKTTNKLGNKRLGGYASFDDTPQNVSVNIIPRFVAALSYCSRAVLTPGSRMAHSYPQPNAIGGIFNKCGTGSGKWGFECLSLVYFYGKDPYLLNHLGRRPNGWNQPSNDYAEKSAHPCPKPIGMMVWLVERGSLVNEIVCDPFMGSGTTGAACAQLSRQFIGIEREPKYFDIACRRIEEAQKQVALFPHEEPAAKPTQMEIA